MDLGARTPRHATTQFPREMVIFPMSWYQSIGDTAQETKHDEDGHLAVWDVPELLAADPKKFLGKEGPASGVLAD